MLQNMTSLTQVRLDNNHFTGLLPDLSRLSNLEEFSTTNNQLTGIVNLSLVHLPKLAAIDLSGNLLQGPAPNFINDSKLILI